MHKRKNQEPDAPAVDEAAGGEATGDEVEVEPGDRAVIAEAPVADVDAEFATDWHRERYVADVERELEGAKLRLADLEELGAHPDVLADQETIIDNARAELIRVTKGDAKS